MAGVTVGPPAGDSVRRFTWLRLVLSLLALLALVLRLAPLQPVLPSRALDPSWQWSLNEGVTQGLSFGRDIVFTGGPASSVVTTMYHPSTYIGSVILSMVLAVVAWAAVRSVCGPKRWVPAVISTVALAGLYDREGLILLIPLLSVSGLARALTRESKTLGAVWLVAAASVIAIVLAAKGSMVPLAGGSYVALVTLSLRRGWLALVAAVLPPAALVGLWWLLGQPLDSVWPFLSGVVELASGYTEAMSLGDPVGDLPVYLLLGIAGFVMSTGLARLSGLTRQSSLALSALAALTVATAMKLGFVRSDQHVLIAFSALVGLGSFVMVVANRSMRTGVWAALTVAFAAVGIGFGPGALGTVLPVHQYAALASAVAAYGRATGSVPSLEDQYDRALTSIIGDSTLPTLAGTADTYSYDQSDLLARSMDWNPRPVVQSYSAYSVKLAELNRAHLEGPSAPEWVIFAPQAIDDRYPSIEDGPSWPELLRRYEPAAFADGKVILHRTAMQPRTAQPAVSSVSAAQLGERTGIPLGMGLCFARFEIHPNMLGRLALATYKSDPLRLTVWTADGAERTYRMPLGMAQAGFLLSPTVSTGADFASLYGDEDAYRSKARTVVAIRVNSASEVWEREYQVSFEPIAVRAP